MKHWKINKLKFVDRFLALKWHIWNDVWIEIKRFVTGKIFSKMMMKRCWRFERYSILICNTVSQHITLYDSHAHLHITTETDPSYKFTSLWWPTPNSSTYENAIYKRLNSSIPNKSPINRYCQLKWGDTFKQCVKILNNIHVHWIEKVFDRANNKCMQYMHWFFLK